MLPRWGIVLLADCRIGLGLRTELASMRVPNAYWGLVSAAAGIERRAKEGE